MKVKMANVIPHPMAWNTLFSCVHEMRRHEQIEGLDAVYGACFQMAAFWEGMRNDELDFQDLARIARQQAGNLMDLCRSDKHNGEYLSKRIRTVMLETDLGVASWGAILELNPANSTDSQAVQEQALRPFHTKLAELVNQTASWREALPLADGANRTGLGPGDKNMKAFGEAEHPLIVSLLTGSWVAAEMIWEKVDKAGRQKLLDDALLAVVCQIHSSNSKNKITDHSVAWASRLLRAGADPNQARQAKSQDHVHHGTHLIFSPIDGMSAPFHEKDKLIEAGWNLKDFRPSRGPNRTIKAPYECMICANDLVLMNLLEIKPDATGNKWLNIWARHWHKNPPKTALRLYGKALDAFFWHTSDNAELSAFFHSPSRDPQEREKERDAKLKLLEEIREKVIPVLSEGYYEERSETEYDPGWSAWDIASSMLASGVHRSSGAKQAMTKLIDSIPQDRHITSFHLASIVKGALSESSFRMQAYLPRGADGVSYRPDIDHGELENILSYAIGRCPKERMGEMMAWCEDLMDLIGQAREQIMDEYQRSKENGIGARVDENTAQAWKSRILLLGSIPGKTQEKIDGKRQSMKM